MIKKLDAEIIDLIDDETALIEEIEQVDNYKETSFSALIKADKPLGDTSTVTRYCASHISSYNCYSFNQGHSSKTT